MRMFEPLLAAAAALAFGAATAAAEAQTLKTVQDRGTLVCGVSQGIAGFSIKDDKGEWSGFDVDFCRALAAAIFNDPSKVQFVPLTASERFDALKNKQIDVLSRNSTWTLGRESDSGLVFAGVDYYDGQAFLVPKSRNLTSALELDGSKRVHPEGHDLRAQRGRLLRDEPHQLRDRRGRDRRRRRVGLSRRQVQHAVDRRIATLRPALAVSQAERSHDPA